MRKSGTILILFGTMLGTVALAGVNAWSTNGPYGGIFMTVVVDYRTPNIVYAGSFGGGVFKSMNWGQSWSTVNSGLTDHDIYSLAMHPENPIILYAGTGASGVFKSLDGGSSWSPTGTGLSGTEYFGLAIDPVNPEIIYTGTNGTGAFKSVNGGESWTPINQGMTSEVVDCFAVDPRNNQSVYAGTWSGVHHSADGGETWVARNAGLGNLVVWSVAIHPVDSKIIYVGTEGGVYKSVDGGVSWQQEDPDISWFRVQSLGINPMAPDTVYAGGLGGVFKTDTGGSDWNYSVDGLDLAQVWGLAIDPRSPDTLYIGSWGRGVYRTSNGGTNWIAARSGLVGTIVNSVAVNPRDSREVYAGVVGDLYRTLDGGQVWSRVELNNGGNILEVVVDPVDPDILYAGSLSNLHRTLDNGQHWASIRGDLPGGYIYSVAIDRRNHQNVYVGLRPIGTIPAVIYKSGDYGDNWQPAGAGLPNASVMDLAVNPYQGNILYAALWGQGIYKSSDSGGSWELASANPGLLTARCLLIHPVLTDMIFAGSSSGVYRSVNGGAAWGSFNNGLTNLFVSALTVDPNNTDTMYAGTLNGLFLSPNKGMNWESLSGIFTNNPINSIAAGRQSPPSLYAGTNGGVYSRVYAENLVDLYYRSGQPGGISPGRNSQILPASSILLSPGPLSFPDASSENPAIIEIGLPPGVALSQTLATGNLEEPWKADLFGPVSLAVSEYGFNPSSGSYEPVEADSVTSGIGPDAVQLFRYVAGEDRILLRLNESSLGWNSAIPDHFIGFTVGVGANVWPPVGGSNFGQGKRFSQPNTQFHVDLHDYDFDLNEGEFPVTVRAFSQLTGEEYPVWPGAESAVIFKSDPGWQDELADVAQMDNGISDFTTADLNGDGLEDLIAINARENQLTISFRQSDGAFSGLLRRQLAGASPLTVEAADVSSDGRPDILVALDDRTLVIFLWESLEFTDKRSRSVLPSQMVTLPGTVSASIVNDVNGDQLKDFIYTDQVNDELTVLFGNSFTTPATYESQSGPMALASGDFNADLAPDIVVINGDAGSISVFINDSAGIFSRTDYSTGQSEPVDVRTGDFNRDGRDDVVLALTEKDSIAVWPSQANGLPQPSLGQTVYFINTPSAIQVENFDGRHGPDILVGFENYHQLALCTTDASGIISYAYSINTLGDLELDPVNHVTLTENSVLAVAGGTALGGVSTRNGVAAIADQPFNLVHFPRSQGLSFSVVNLGDESALISLELFDDNGQYRSSATASISSRQQFPRYLTDPALLGAQADNPNRWARAFLTRDQTYGFWLANESASLVYLDGLKLADVRDAKTSFVLPAVPVGADGYVRVILVNPGLSQAQAVIRRMGSGLAQESVSLNMAGRSRHTFLVSETFEKMGNTEYLQVDSDRPIIGCELFGDEQKMAALDALVIPDTVQSLYCPHVAVGNLGVDYQSYLTLVNPTGEDITADILLIDDTGTALGTVSELRIDARSKTRRDVADLFDLTSPATGFVVVQGASGPGLTGSVTFGETGEGRFLSALPMISPSDNHFIVGHLANGTLGSLAFFTGLSLVNPDSSDTSVKLTAYDQNGLQLAAGTVNVAAGSRQVFLLDHKLTELTSIFGGYLIIENQTTSSDGLLVFALFGDQSFNFISAVSAVPIRRSNQ